MISTVTFKVTKVSCLIILVGARNDEVFLHSKRQLSVVKLHQKITFSLSIADRKRSLSLFNLRNYLFFQKDHVQHLMYNSDIIGHTWRLFSALFIHTSYTAMRMENWRRRRWSKGMVGVMVREKGHTLKQRPYNVVGKELSI